MKRLLIDAGNTNIKFAWTEDGRWLSSFVLPTAEASSLRCAGADEVWVSNVAGDAVAACILAASPVPPRFISSVEFACGVRNRYDCPETLGCDRWAALIAARHLFGRACLVVSSGTATTIDALSQDGEFLGGLILPGLELMKRSLAGATAQLNFAGGEYRRFPRNTADAMQSGAIQAVCGAIMLQHALLGVTDAPVLLSGGGAAVLLPNLNLPVQSVDNPVLQGLSLIAQEAGKA